jgi:lambda repressor-like predicted transcriptional regulator
MATRNEVLAEIIAYTVANGRPCPANYLTDKFGAEAADIIAALKKDGTVIGKRGRSGGLVSTGAAADTNTAPVHETPADAIAAEFAALAEKLAAEESAPAAVNG